MTEKEYTVIANTREDLPALEAEITASGGAGPIPNRSVDVANPRPGSRIQTHFMLTDEEAEELRSDPRVRAVEIPPDQRDDISIGLNAIQRGEFARNNTLDNTHVNWGLRRCTSIDTPYSNSGDRVESISQGNTGQSPNYEYAIDGRGVDVVVQDSGIDGTHPEWNYYNTGDLIETINGAGNDLKNFDVTNGIQTKAQYFPDPNLLQEDKFYSVEFISSGTSIFKSDKKFRNDDQLLSEQEFCFDGFSFKIGMDSATVTAVGSSGGTLLIRTPEDIESLATSEIPTRLQEIDWYTESGLTGTQDTNFYTDYDGHGSHCASIAAGLIYGWAKGAHIYAQKLGGLEGAGDPNSGIPLSDAFDTIRLWHNAKTNGRPTVVNMSWGYTSNVTGDPSVGTYRGTAWTYGVDYTSRAQLQAATGVSQNYFDGGTSHKIPVRVASVDAEVDDMIADGIHICIAAGNNLHKIDLSTGPDYNNQVTFNGGNRTYHRGSSPYSIDAFMVGNADSGFQNSGGVTGSGDTREQTSTSTARGPGVNIFAPGTDIIAASSTNYNASKFTVAQYPGNASYNVMKIGGTSMAAPQVAGVVAQHLQIRPDLTPAQMQQRIFDDALIDVMDNTGTDTDYQLIYNCLMGSPNRFLYSKYGRQAITTNAGGAAKLFTEGPYRA